MVKYITGISLYRKNTVELSPWFHTNLGCATSNMIDVFKPLLRKTSNAAILHVRCIYTTYVYSD